MKFFAARSLLALAAGALLALAFAPFNLWAIGILSPAVLVHLWRNAAPRQAFRDGYMFGIGLFSAGTSWLHISINLFGGVNLAGAIGLTFIFILFLALFPALAGYLAVRCSVRKYPVLTVLLIIPACWTLIEWIRSWIFTGFPWLSIGYSQTDSILNGLAPLGGVFAISLAVMSSAAALQALWSSSNRDRTIIVSCVALIWMVSAWSSGHDWTTARMTPVSVALVQGAVPQELKWSPAMRQPTLDRYTGLTLPHLGTDLIVWPEAAIPAFYDQVQPYMEEMSRLARSQNSWLMTGMPYRDIAAGKYLNGIVMLGDQTSFYFKRHLVPFGEYLPLEFILRPIVDALNIPMSDFSNGDNVAPVLYTNDFGIGVSICYEDTFGNEVIEALPEAAILVNVSNDAWFGDSQAPHQHLQMARMRAIETGRYLLRSTNTGITAIIDEKGRIVDSIPQFTPATLTGEARLYDGITPYAGTGNWTVLILIFGTLLMAGLIQRQHRTAR